MQHSFPHIWWGYGYRQIFLTTVLEKQNTWLLVEEKIKRVGTVQTEAVLCLVKGVDTALLLLRE